MRKIHQYYNQDYGVTSCPVTCKWWQIRSKLIQIGYYLERPIYDYPGVHINAFLGKRGKQPQIKLSIVFARTSTGTMVYLVKNKEIGCGKKVFVTHLPIKNPVDYNIEKLLIQHYHEKKNK